MGSGSAGSVGSEVEGVVTVVSAVESAGSSAKAAVQARPHTRAAASRVLRSFLNFMSVPLFFYFFSGQTARPRIDFFIITHFFLQEKNYFFRYFTTGPAGRSLNLLAFLVKI